MQTAEMGYAHPVQTEAWGASREQSKSGGGQGGASCCFIFMEGNMLMPDVRRYRDEFYPKDGMVSKGYKAMANWLVPAMRKSTLVKKAVEVVMLRPLALLAKLYYEKNPAWMLLAPAKWFWCDMVWRGLGLFQLPQYTWELFYKKN